MRRLLLLLVVVLWGCQQAQVAMPLRVGSNQWIGYEPVYLARSLGWLDERKVRLVELPSATQVMQALRHGNLEAGMLTLDEVLTLRARGCPWYQGCLFASPMPLAAFLDWLTSSR